MPSAPLSLAHPYLSVISHYLVVREEDIRSFDYDRTRGMLQQPSYPTQLLLQRIVYGVNGEGNNGRDRRNKLSSAPDESFPRRQQQQERLALRPRKQATPREMYGRAAPEESLLLRKRPREEKVSLNWCQPLSGEVKLLRLCSLSACFFAWVTSRCPSKALRRDSSVRQLCPLELSEGKHMLAFVCRCTLYPSSFHPGILSPSCRQYDLTPLRLSHVPMAKNGLFSQGRRTPIRRLSPPSPPASIAAAASTTAMSPTPSSSPPPASDDLVAQLNALVAQVRRCHVKSRSLVAASCLSRERPSLALRLQSIVERMSP